MKCLILAGGFGTRLYPLTIYKAKALLEYKGQPRKAGEQGRKQYLASRAYTL